VVFVTADELWNPKDKNEKGGNRYFLGAFPALAFVPLASYLGAFLKELARSVTFEFGA
jgi:hypothetical protein